MTTYKHLKVEEELHKELCIEASNMKVSLQNLVHTKLSKKLKKDEKMEKIETDEIIKKWKPILYKFYDKIPNWLCYYCENHSIIENQKIIDDKPSMMVFAIKIGIELSKIIDPTKIIVLDSPQFIFNSEKRQVQTYSYKIVEQNDENENMGIYFMENKIKNKESKYIDDIIKMIMDEYKEKSPYEALRNIKKDFVYTYDSLNRRIKDLYNIVVDEPYEFLDKCLKGEDKPYLFIYSLCSNFTKENIELRYHIEKL